MRWKRCPYLNGSGMGEAQFIDSAQKRPREMQLVKRAGNVLSSGLCARVKEFLAGWEFLVLPLHDRLHTLDYVLCVF